LILRIWTAFSTRSLRQNRTAWAWVCRYAVRSSRGTAGASGRRAGTPTGPFSTSFCRASHPDGDSERRALAARLRARGRRGRCKIGRRITEIAAAAPPIIFVLSDQIAVTESENRRLELALSADGRRRRRAGRRSNSRLSSRGLLGYRGGRQPRKNRRRCDETSRTATFSWPTACANGSS
jgi:hypothetical protein